MYQKKQNPTQTSIWKKQKNKKIIKIKKAQKTEKKQKMSKRKKAKEKTQKHENKWKKMGKIITKQIYLIPIPWSTPCQALVKPLFRPSRNLIFQHILTKNILKKNRLNFIRIAWKWTIECFKTDCGHNFLIITNKVFKNIKVFSTYA